MCYNPISPIKTILCIITKIVFFTWILAMSEPSAVVRCYSIFVLLHSLLQAHWAGVCVSADHWCQPAWLAWERVPGRNHSAGTAAVFKVLELGRGLSIYITSWFCYLSSPEAASTLDSCSVFLLYQLLLWYTATVSKALWWAFTGRVMFLAVCKPVFVLRVQGLSYSHILQASHMYGWVVFFVSFPNLELQIWKFRYPG